VAGLVVWREPGQTAIGILAWLQALGRFELALLAGAAAVLLQFWFSVHILRQNGRLMLRLETVEAQVGQQGDRPAPPPPGLPVNTAAPDFPLTALDGGAVTLGSWNDFGKPLVLVFSELECSLCDKLMPEVAQWQKEFKDRIWIGLISRGSAEANRAKTTKHQVENVLLQKDREVASAYLVEGTPSAVLVKGGLIASPVAAGAEEIRNLVSRATLPPPVQKGDLVPSLRLADLTGKSLDLATLRGRLRLLLFWNPSCGFCQRMLPDVRMWESNPPHGAPELVIISSGSFDANLQQGFRSRVLLDPNFGAGYVFRSGGTPSAVLIDEDGRIASDVGVGAEEVFALTGSASAVNGGSRSA
jgi:thiol-disulfide isomerase/thioredoxin